MRTNIDKTKKKIYNSPTVVCIQLDNEISLALASAPGDPEPMSKVPEYFNNDPFKTTLS